MSVKLHPLQVRGKYYVDENCYCTTACVVEAPDNISIDADGAYVFRQPETPEQEAACKRATEVCPHEAVRSDGRENF